MTDSKNNSSDEELLSQLKQDNEVAFQKFYQRHSSRVYAYAVKRLGSAELANEAVQIIFWQIFKKRELYNPQYKALQWLYIIARSEIKDLRNREGRFKHDSLEDLENSPDLSQNAEFAPNIQSKEEVDLLLGELAPETRDLMKMKYIEEMSFDEIAEVLGKSSTSLRQTLSRALRKLQKKRQSL